MSRSKEERETIYRFDETDDQAVLWTASKHERRRWERAGLVIASENGGWRTHANRRQIRVRKLRKDAKNLPSGTKNAQPYAKPSHKDGVAATGPLSPPGSLATRT